MLYYIIKYYKYFGESRLEFSEAWLTEKEKKSNKNGPILQSAELLVQSKPFQLNRNNRNKFVKNHCLCLKKRTFCWGNLHLQKCAFFSRRFLWILFSARVRLHVVCAIYYSICTEWSCIINMNVHKVQWEEEEDGAGGLSGPKGRFGPAGGADLLWRLKQGTFQQTSERICFRRWIFCPAKSVHVQRRREDDFLFLM